MRIEELNLLLNAIIAITAVSGTLISLYFSRKSLNEISMQRLEKMKLEKPVLRFSIDNVSISDGQSHTAEFNLQVMNLTKYDAQNILIFSENRFKEISMLPIALFLYVKESSEQVIKIWLDTSETKPLDTLYFIYQDLYTNPYFTEFSFQLLSQPSNLHIGQSVCSLPILLPKDKYYLLNNTKDYSLLEAPLIKRRGTN